ncbi:glycosyltransferase [Hymenobacter jejuensis]|uniref:Streptomycin biosynthesis protein StrF domain-containing protein n=1 Tax=Hymenobacter jejuensis TaxID=2502781 RepID=A0A5B7ZWN6_9BACT|nr:glycosyltransferase [Hymenobacter jejuensis]QDA59350.1 hypothetical protein FHG12_04180 [Hymenobacter jejuensis]
MISIVISTYRPRYLNKLKQNIDLTIGVEYEIIAIDNTGARMGLCELYNMGAKRAKYDIVCFMHEDIDIKTNNWGSKVIDIFSKHAHLGLLGVAGSGYKPAMPSGWFFPWINKRSLYINTLQRLNDTNKVDRTILNPNNEVLSKVVAVDGFWLCTKKDITLEIPFDQLTFKSFHCYDIDFSLSVYQKYDVAVTYEILIEHFSEGNFDTGWLIETIKLHKKWIDYLPINLVRFNSLDQVLTEEGAFYFILPLLNKDFALYKDVYELLWSRSVRSLLPLKSFLKLNFLLSTGFMKKMVAVNKK